MKKWFPRNLCSGLILGAVFASAAVSAADSGSATAAKKKLGKVVVTAQAEQESAHPSSQVVNREALDNQQVTDLDDLVRYIPGVSVSEIGRFGANGFNIRGLDGDRVAMTVDGLSMGETLDPASYQAYDFFRSTRGGLDIDALKSVEIIKGADSIAAGSGGLSGAVMFVTKDPADYLAAQGDDTFFSLKTGYASDADEALLSATLANRTGAWESLLVLTQRNSHELEVQGKGENITGGAREIADPLDAESTNALFKLYFYADPVHRLGLVAETYRANSQLNNLSRVDASYLTRTTDDDNERDRLGVNYQWLAESRWFDVFDWHYDYQNSYNSGYTLMLFKSTTCPQGVSPCYRSEDRHYEQDTHSTRVKFSKNITGNALEQELIYGLGAEQREVSYASIDTRYLGTSNTASLVEIDPDFVPETAVTHWHGFVRDQISPLNSPWTFNAGARVDSYAYSPEFNPQYQDASNTVGDVNFTQATWQLGANYQFTAQQHLAVQLGTGFRAPSTENLYYAPVTSVGIDASSGAEVVLWDSVANPDLKAEESLNKELRYGFANHRVQINAAIFHDDYNNFIETQTLTRLNDTVFQSCSRGTCTNATGDTYTMPVNSGEVVVKGFEIDGQWNLDRNLALRFAYSYNDGEKKNGDPLLSIVPHSGVVGIEYQPNDRRWAASVSMTRSGSKQADDVVVTAADGSQTQGAAFLTDAFTLFDLQGRYQITPALKMTFGLYNITDEQYWRWQRVQFVTEGAGGARGGVTGDGINRYAEPGRNFKASVSYRF
ncbi:TonB-dependent hemoglobin/transferrin/lactoferrin family receptor [Cellvibrio fontiphilus]|uniref:TonB-dependent hemoglobin/transferrin/lactoferrin family receptor n=1 Tax=Cellvibrio fontiphilus TaxID=1815559 RepID=A0ABV7FEU0_9GAMM